MNSALWVSKTGLAAQDTALRTISNNLANVGTTGFKKDRAVFEDLMYQINQQPGGQSSQDSTLPTGVQLGTGVRIASTQKQFTVGSLQPTERNLDLAIEGNGFFQVALPDGSIGLESVWALLLNPWALVQYWHNMNGSVVTACFVVASIGAFYLLSGRHEAYGRTFVRLGDEHRVEPRSALFAELRELLGPSAVL